MRCLEIPLDERRIGRLSKPGSQRYDCDVSFGWTTLKFLLSAQQMGLRGETVCTLGHQALFISNRELRRLLAEFQREPFSLPSNRAMWFAEDALTPLGFRQVDSMDASDYEGASIIHDLNVEIGPELVERYDLVWDNGTLEHVFDFPTAILNAMRMTKVGGHILLGLPANNQCGHGFYQFSPELLFRVFTPRNGFELLRLYMSSEGRLYHVVDPMRVHGRVELLSPKVAMIFVHARKLQSISELATPQQSDYEASRNEQSKGSNLNDGRAMVYLRTRLSAKNVARVSFLLNKLRRHRAVWKWRTGSRLSNRAFYVPVTDWTIKSSDVFGR